MPDSVCHTDLFWHVRDLGQIDDVTQIWSGTLGKGGGLVGIPP